MRAGAAWRPSASPIRRSGSSSSTTAARPKAARRPRANFVAAKVPIVVGFLCTEAIEAALPILKEANIPVITVGVRTDSLTDRRSKTGWPVYRLARAPTASARRPARLLARLWERELFAIVDDGTIYGRELVRKRSRRRRAGRA